MVRSQLVCTSLMTLLASMTGLPSQVQAQEDFDPVVECQPVALNIQRQIQKHTLDWRVQEFYARNLLCLEQVDEAVIIARSLPDLSIENQPQIYDFLAQALFHQNPANTAEIVQAFLAALITSSPEKEAPTGVQWAIAYRQLGDLYLGDENKQRSPEHLQQARSFYEKALEFDSQNIEALEQISRVDAFLQNWEQAKQTYQKVLEINPKYKTATATQKQAQMQFFLGQMYQALGETNAAIAAYQQAVQLNPSLDLAYQGLGRLYVSQKNKKLAFKALYNQIQAEEISDGISYGSEQTKAGLAYARLGTLFEAQQDWKKAAKAYGQSIQLQGDVYESLFDSYALMLLKLNQNQKALAAYLQYVQSSPFDTDRTPEQQKALAYQSFGDALSRLQNFTAANQAYEAAFQLDASVAPTLHYQADYFIAKKDFKGAIALYESAPQQNFHSGDWSMLGKLYAHENRRDEALKAFREYLQLSVDFGSKLSETQLKSQAYIEMAHSLGLSQPSQAIQAYREAIALQPSWHYIYNWIGDIQWDQGQFQAAIESFQRALQQRETPPPSSLAISDLATIHNKLGLLFMQQRQYAEARQAFQDSVRLDQTNPEYRLNFAQAQEAIAFKREGPPTWDVTTSAREMQGQIDSILGIAGLAKGPMPPTPTSDLEQYRQRWAKQDATVAPWLGHWVNRDLFTPFYEVDIYPSALQGQVCVISRQINHVSNYSVMGEQVLPNASPQFSVLKVASLYAYGQKLMTHELLRQRAQNPLTGDPLEFLGLINRSSSEMRIYAAQAQPNAPTFWPMAVQQQWEAYQCRYEAT